MGGFGPDGYTARTVDELYEAYISAADAVYDDELEPYNGAINRAFFRAFSRAVHENQEQDLEDLYDSMFVVSAEGDELTELARQYTVERQPAVAASGVVEWSSDQTTSDRVLQSGLIVETEGNDPIQFRTTSAETMAGEELLTDDTDYTTSDTVFVAKTTFTVDVDYRDSLSMSADASTSDGSHAAYVNFRDTTNSVDISTVNTTATSATTLGPETYDVSSLSGDIIIEVQLRIADASATASLLYTEIDVPGQYGALQNVQAVEAGTIGNVGADRITVMPSPPSFVSGVTNPQPTGDPTYTLADSTVQQTLGQNREEDDSLRERVLEGSSIGGSATVRAVRDKIRSLDGVPSLTIYTNRQTTDNANGNGLPELSSELVIHAPSVTDEDVGQAIFDVVSIGERLVSGINGTAASTTISSEVLEQDWTVVWTKPNVTNLEITLDIVTASGYDGREAILTNVANYIGGTLPDGSPTPGLDVADDVIVDELERLVNSVDGVVGTATVTLDANGDGTDDTTTRSDGLQAYEVAKNEVAQVDTTTDVIINS